MTFFAVVTIIGPNKQMRRFTTAYIQGGLRSSVWRLRLSFRFGIQIVGDEDATMQFSMSVVGQPMNTLAPIVSRSQSVSRTITNTSKQPYFTTVGRETDRQCGCIQHSWLATNPADYLRRVALKSLHTDRASHRQCTHATTEMLVLTRSSYNNFPLPIMNLFNPILE